MKLKCNNNRTRVGGFLFGFALTGSIGAYFFYWNFNGTADEIKAGINELSQKWQKDRGSLEEKISDLQARVEKLEGTTQESE